MAHGGRHCEYVNLCSGQPIGVEFYALAQMPDVIFHKERGLISLVLNHFAAVIPAEFGQLRLPHPLEHCQFALGRGVQAYEYEFRGVRECVLQHVARAFALEPLGQSPVYHTFVGFALLAEGAIEGFVKRI